jgi:hypothetical protein
MAMDTILYPGIAECSAKGERGPLSDPPRQALDS